MKRPIILAALLSLAVLAPAATDPSMNAVVSTSGTGTVQVFPAGGTIACHQFDFQNPTGSGAFDYSLDGGNTWHTLSLSSGPYGLAKTINGNITPNAVYIRRNASTDVAGLIVTLWY